MRLLELPQRVSDAIDTLNRGVCEIRTSISAVLFPLTLLLWICLIAVFVELYKGDSSFTRETFVHRTVSGAIDQLLYVVFYFSLPFTWHVCRTNVARVRESADWIMVDDTYVIEDDWIIISNVDKCSNENSQ